MASISSRRSCTTSSYIVSLDGSFSCHFPPPPPLLPARHLDYSRCCGRHLPFLHPAPPGYVDLRSSPRKCQLGKSRLHTGLPRVKFSFSSLLAKLKHSVLPAAATPSAPAAAPAAGGSSIRGLSANHHLARGSTYRCGAYPDAVVDCIQYIKQTAAIREPIPTGR